MSTAEAITGVPLFTEAEAAAEQEKSAELARWREYIAYASASCADITDLEEAIGAMKQLTGEALGATGFDLATIDDPPAEEADRNYLVPALGIAPGAPAGFFAYSFTGKSIILQDLCLSIASGSLVFGEHLCRRGPVVHVDYEQGRAETVNRYHRLMRGRGLGATDLGGRLRFASLPRTFLNSPGAEEAFRRACEGAALVYVDTLGAGSPGVDMNDPRAAEPLLMLGRVSEATGAVVVVAGHTGKADVNTEPGRSRDARTSPAGSQAILASCGAAFRLSGGNGAPVKVEQIKGRALGAPPVEPFFLVFEVPRIDGFTNRNPGCADDPGGFRVIYRTAEQIDRGPAGPVDRLAGLAETALRLLREAAQQGRGMSAFELSKAMGVNQEKAGAVLERLRGKNAIAFRPVDLGGWKARWWPTDMAPPPTPGAPVSPKDMPSARRKTSSTEPLSRSPGALPALSQETGATALPLSPPPSGGERGERARPARGVPDTADALGRAPAPATSAATAAAAGPHQAPTDPTP